jgi:hypothetical protein
MTLCHGGGDDEQLLLKKSKSLLKKSNLLTHFAYFKQVFAFCFFNANAGNFLKTGLKF